MGKIEFANCQDVRNQKRIQELDCPHCHEPVSYTHLDVYKRQMERG